MARKYKYYASGLPSSDSVVRMRSHAVKALERDPDAYNPVNVYSESYTMGIYPCMTVKRTADGRFICREGGVWREIDRKGNLKR